MECSLVSTYHHELNILLSRLTKAQKAHSRFEIGNTRFEVRDLRFNINITANSFKSLSAYMNTLITLCTLSQEMKRCNIHSTFCMQKLQQS